jgi:hypothetical protein
MSIASTNSQIVNEVTGVIASGPYQRYDSVAKAFRTIRFGGGVADPSRSQELRMTWVVRLTDAPNCMLYVSVESTSHF